MKTERVSSKSCRTPDEAKPDLFGYPCPPIPLIRSRYLVRGAESQIGWSPQCCVGAWKEKEACRYLRHALCCAAIHAVRLTDGEVADGAETVVELVGEEADPVV